MIIACDFDGTIQVTDGKFNRQLLAFLTARQRSGDTVILWTCREGIRLRDALQFCMANGFRPNCVNQNCPEGIRRMGHDSRKIFADIYIDDKNAAMRW